jgi:hypothetical protein
MRTNHESNVFPHLAPSVAAMISERVNRKLLRAAKKAMKQLESCMSCTEGGDAWNALYSAVRAAEKLQVKEAQAH